MTVDALVVEDLNVDVLTGTPSMITMTYLFAQLRDRFLSKAPKYCPTIPSQVPVPRFTPSVAPSLMCYARAHLQQWSSLGNILS